MEQKEKKPVELAKLTKDEKIALISEQIKGKVLFPKKVAEANRILDRARFGKPKITDNLK